MAKALERRLGEDGIERRGQELDGSDIAGATSHHWWGRGRGGGKVEVKDDDRRENRDEDEDGGVGCGFLKRATRRALWSGITECPAEVKIQRVLRFTLAFHFRGHAMHKLTTVMQKKTTRRLTMDQPRHCLVN